MQNYNLKFKINQNLNILHLTLSFSILIFSFFIFTAHSVHAGTIIKSPAYLGLNRGLVGCWNFDGSNTQAQDCSGNNNVGTLVGGTKKALGKVGQALRYDGIDDYVDMGDKTNFEFASGQSFTFSWWIKAVPSAFQNGIITKGYDGVTATNEIPWYLSRFNSGSEAGRLDFLLRDSASNTFTVAATNLVDNAWHYVTVIYDAGAATLTIYVDLAYKDQAISVNPDAYGANIGSLILGIHNAAYYVGLIDDLRIYNRTLSGSEVSRLYRIGLGSTANSFSKNLGIGKYTGFKFSTPEASQPDGITYLNGFFWIVANSNDEVYKYNTDGTYTGTSFDTNADGVTFPQGITSYDGYLWIVDLADAEVYKYTTGGTYTGTSFDTDASGNSNPYGITFFNGFFWITDTTDDKVYKYNTDGSYTGNSFDTAGSGNNDPVGIVGYNNAFWIADRTNIKIYKYDLSGSYTGFSFDLSLSPAFSAQGLAFYKNAFWLGSLAQSTIYKFNAAPPFTANTTLSGGSLSSGLVGHWTFDGADIGSSGTVAKDRSGNNNNGTITGAVASSGKIGQALQFDGVDDQVIQTPSNTNLYFPSGNFSYGGWFKPNDDSDEEKALTWDSGSGDPYSIFVDNGGSEQIECLIDLASSDALAQWFTTLNTGQWYFITCVFNDASDTVDLYVDGVYRASGVGSGAIVKGDFGSQSLVVGSDGGVVTFWTGSVDDVRIYNRALSASEINKLYQMSR